VIETICYGTILDNPLVEQFEESQSPDEVSSVFTYFGSWTGVMRIFPGASYGNECGDYDPRIRPWSALLRTAGNRMSIKLQTDVHKT